MPVFEESKTVVKKDSNQQFEQLLSKQPLTINSLHNSPNTGKIRFDSPRNNLSMLRQEVGIKQSPKEPSQDSDLLELIRFVPLVKESRCLLKTNDINRVKDSECVVFKVNQTLPDAGSKTGNKKATDHSN